MYTSNKASNRHNLASGVRKFKTYKTEERNTDGKTKSKNTKERQKLRKDKQKHQWEGFDES